MPKILIVGGGYAGFYTAFKLEGLLRKGEAEVTIVEPLPYWTYQPFLPEVAAGSIEPRHAVVPIRQHLPKTRVLAAKVTSIPAASVIPGGFTSSGVRDFFRAMGSLLDRLRDRRLDRRKALRLLPR